MNCEEARDLAPDYLDRRMTPFQIVLFREHVDACAECRRELGDLDATIKMIGSLDEVETAPDFLARVNQKIDAGFHTGRIRAWLFEPARIKLPLEAAALLLVSSLAVYLYHRAPQIYEDKALNYQEKYQLAQKPERSLATPRSDQPTGQKPLASLIAPAAKEARRPIPAAPEARQESRPAAPPAEAAPESSGSIPTAAAPRAAAAPAVADEKRAALPAPPIAAGLAGRRLEQAKMVPFEIIEVAPEDAGRLEQRLHALVPELGGKIVTKQATEDGLTLAIELPESRVAEFKSALKREAGGEAQDTGSFQQGTAPSLMQGGGSVQTQGQASLYRGRPNLQRALASDPQQEEPKVNIELRIRPKK